MIFQICQFRIPHSWKPKNEWCFHRFLGKNLKKFYFCLFLILFLCLFFIFWLFVKSSKKLFLAKKIRTLHYREAGDQKRHFLGAKMTLFRKIRFLANKSLNWILLLPRWLHVSAAQQLLVHPHLRRQLHSVHLQLRRQRPRREIAIFSIIRTPINVKTSFFDNLTAT